MAIVFQNNLTRIYNKENSDLSEISNNSIRLIFWEPHKIDKDLIEHLINKLSYNGAFLLVTDWLHYSIWESLLNSDHIQIRQIWFWKLNKFNPKFNYPYLKEDIKMIIFASKGAFPIFDKYQSNLFEYTQKVNLIQHLLDMCLSDKTNSIVLDPDDYITAIACKNLGYQCIAYTNKKLDEMNLRQIPIPKSVYQPTLINLNKEE